MTINGRLLLLVVATGLFVRVWNANDRPRPRTHVRTPDRVSGIVTGPHPDSVVRRDLARAVGILTNSATVEVSVTKESVRGAEENWTANDCPIPLPAGVAAGSYRVVSDSGRVACLEIAPSADAGQKASASLAKPEFYVLADGSSRWYFIRLHESVAPQAEILPPGAFDIYGDGLITQSTSHRPFINRKFDFTGYVDAKWLDAPLPVTDEIACPEPPDLPVPR
jgi:hypothetical protein